MMKHPYRRSLALLSVGAAASMLLFSGCLTTANEPAPTGQEMSPAAQEQGMRALLGMGFTRDQIQPRANGFLVEGDMFFQGKDLIGPKPLAKTGPLAKTAQRANAPVSTPFPNTLKLAIHPSMADWAIYIYQAVNNWNFLNTRLHIEVVSSGQDITVYSAADAACPAGLQTTDPKVGGISIIGANGQPGYAACINRGALYVDQPGPRVAVITHELGHTLAFQHTFDESKPFIPGTPENDNGSIMNALYDKYATGNFSNGDRQAVELLYPSSKPLGGSDLDWDGKDDLVAWRPSDGNWLVLGSSTGYATGFTTQWGQLADMPMGGMDMDGDHKSDFVVWRPSNGYWFAQLSTGGNRSIQWGQLGDVPIAGHDMDGDGKSDLVIWRWSEGKFYVLTSRSDYTAGYWYGWGQAGDIPVGGIDADKDGIDDWVVWRPSEGIFYVEYSSTGFTTANWFGYGQAGDIPVGRTDLDLDGKDDLVLWRPSNSTCYARGSRGDYFSYASTIFGGRGDVPLVGSFIDQDTLRDLVFWRPWKSSGSEGLFFVKKSGSAFTSGSTYAWPPR